MIPLLFSFMMANVQIELPPLGTNYCAGFTKCEYDDTHMEIDVSEEGLFVSAGRRVQIRQALEAYCQTHDGASVTVHIQGGTAEGQCGE